MDCFRLQLVKVVGHFITGKPCSVLLPLCSFSRYAAWTDYLPVERCFSSTVCSRSPSSASVIGSTDGICAWEWRLTGEAEEERHRGPPQQGPTLSMPLAYTCVVKLLERVSCYAASCTITTTITPKSHFHKNKPKKMHAFKSKQLTACNYCVCILFSDWMRKTNTNGWVDGSRKPEQRSVYTYYIHISAPICPQRTGRKTCILIWCQQLRTCTWHRKEAWQWPSTVSQTYTE